MSKNKNIAIKVIKEVYPGISQQGIDALLANIEIETGFDKFVEIPQDYDKVMANSDLKSMQKNLKTLKGGKKAYDKLSDKEKLGVLYHGNKKAKYAGGIGGLQLTSSNYGGLQDFEADLNKIAATLNMKPEDLYEQAKTDPEAAIKLSLVHLRDIKGVGVQELNITDGKTLRKDYINPYETQGVETPAQAARDTIFNKYTPQVSLDDTTEEEPIDAETKLAQTRQKQKDKDALLNNKYELTAEEQKQVKNAAIKTASDIQARINKGELDGSDDDIKNLYYKELAEKIGVVNVDINDPNSLGRARGFIEYATSISNEELGEQVGGDQFIDSKIEDALENWSNNVNWNLENLGIPKQGQVEVNEPLFTGSVSVPGSVSTESEPQETPPDVELKNIIKQDSALIEESAITGETPEELADRKLQELDYIKKVKEGTATQEEKDAAMKRHEDRLSGLMSEFQTKNQVTDNKGKGKTPLTDEQKAARNKKWMQAGQAGLGILKAAAGIKSLSKALQEHKVDVPELSPLLTEAVNKQRELSKAGFTAEEKASAMTNINNAYASAMKNVLRASGGQRGAFLANQGVVDANRVGALVDLAAKDAAVRRQNIQGFNQLASSVGQMQLNRDMTVEQMKQKTVNQNRQLLSGIGTNLLSGALDEASYYLNPNRKAMDEMTSNILQSLGGSNSGYDPAARSQANITAASQQNAEE